MRQFAFALALIAMAAVANAQVAQIEADSRETREQLRSTLRTYPPSVGRVLRIDPTLLSNDAYLATYPKLQMFLKQHPEVQHNPGFFFEGFADEEPDSPTFREWQRAGGDIAAFLVFLIVSSVVVWIFRAILEQRRWNRLSTIQTDVHSKLLDRFTSNDELLAYLQSPAGKKFFEMAPIPLEAGPRPMSAPVGRIFFSVQVGLVLIAAGVGFDLVSQRATAGAPALYGIGVIALLIGIAMVLSGGIFYLLSRRFGLWPTTVS